MAWTPPKTDFSPGNVLTAAQMNAIGNNLLTGTPALWRLKKTSNQSIPNATETVVTWDTSETAPAFDTNGVFNGATSSSQVIIQTTGVYLLTAEIDFTANNAGRRSIWITRNGTTYNDAIAVQNDVTASAGDDSCAISVIFSLTAADVLRVYAYQNCGVALNVISGSAPANVTTHFAGALLGLTT